MAGETRARLQVALEADDLDAVEALVRDHPDLLKAGRRRPPVTEARSVAMAERLLALGADLEEAAAWWAPGFYTQRVASEVARFLVERGAALTVHAAAGLGLRDRLTSMIDADPAAVHLKGGDGCTPLHFARDVETARLLLDRGARVDARDDDHDSTPAQWAIGDTPEVARFLLKEGAAEDLFLAAALGDRAMAERLIAADRGCLRQRIGRMPEWPPLGHKNRGGTIYQWTLKFNSYAHQIALMKGHAELFDYLWTESDATTRLLVACVLGRREEALAITAEHPGLVAALPEEDKKLPAQYCWETNIDIEAVRLMLDAGFPVDFPETAHCYTPLHNAAWSGDGDLVELLLERGAPVDVVDPRYHSTPLGCMMYDAVFEKRHPEGYFERVTRALVEAGSPWDPLDIPVGHEGIDRVLEPRVRGTAEGAGWFGDEESLGQLSGVEELTRALAGAAKAGRAELCGRLMDRGAAVNGAVGSSGNTALMFAMQGRAGRECVELLLVRGAHADARNLLGTTALVMGAWHGVDVTIVRALLAAGADAGAENQFGYTALRAAEERGHPEIVNALRAPG